MCPLSLPISHIHTDTLLRWQTIEKQTKETQYWHHVTKISLSELWLGLLWCHLSSLNLKQAQSRMRNLKGLQELTMTKLELKGLQKQSSDIFRYFSRKQMCQFKFPLYYNHKTSVPSHLRMPVIWLHVCRTGNMHFFLDSRGIRKGSAQLEGLSYCSSVGNAVNTSGGKQ